VIARFTKDDLLVVKELLEAGHYHAVIDRSYALEDAVAAMRYVETGQKTGNVVLNVEGGRTRLGLPLSRRLALLQGWLGAARRGATAASERERS